MKYINTLDELKNYIGKYVYFYYTNNGEKDGTITYAWAKKITKITRTALSGNDKKHPLKYVNIYGKNTVCFINNMSLSVDGKIPPFLKSTKETYSNAQQFARELTLTENILCRMLVKKEEAKGKGLIKIKPQDDN